MPAKPGHNNPPVILELPREVAEFALENAETNMAQGLSLLMAVQSGAISREGGEKVVTLIEQFRPLRDALREALKP